MKKIILLFVVTAALILPVKAGWFIGFNPFSLQIHTSENTKKSISYEENYDVVLDTAIVLTNEQRLTAIADTTYLCEKNLFYFFVYGVSSYDQIILREEGEYAPCDFNNKKNSSENLKINAYAERIGYDFKFIRLAFDKQKLHSGENTLSLELVSADLKLPFGFFIGAGSGTAKLENLSDKVSYSSLGYSQKITDNFKIEILYSYLNINLALTKEFDITEQRKDFTILRTSRFVGDIGDGNIDNDYDEMPVTIFLTGTQTTVIEIKPISSFNLRVSYSF